MPTIRTYNGREYLHGIYTEGDDTRFTAAGFDRDFVNYPYLGAGFSSDGTTAISANTTTLPGEITTGPLSTSYATSQPYLRCDLSQSDQEYASGSNLYDGWVFRITSFDIGALTSTVTIRRGRIFWPRQSSTGALLQHNLYLFDLPTPMQIRPGVDFQVLFKHMWG